MGQMYVTTQPPGPVGPVVGGGTGTGGEGTVTLSGPLEKLRLNWASQPGLRYQVQRSSDLKTWTNLGAPRSTVGASDFIGVELAGSAGFFRVLRVP